jgi:hypothetical protein
MFSPVTPATSFSCSLEHTKKKKKKLFDNPFDCVMTLEEAICTFMSHVRVRPTRVVDYG